LIILMVVGLFAWGVTGVTAVGLVCSRIMFAAGFDRSLPALLAKVSERFHTPVTAVTIYMALTELGLVLSVYAGVIFEFLNITLVSLYAFVGLAALILPFIRNQMYSNSILARYKLGNIPAISLLGAANLIFFGFLDYFSLLNPAVSGPDWTRSIGTLIGIFLLGVVSYFLVTRYYHSKGIDVSLAFKEIPPE